MQNEEMEPPAMKVFVWNNPYDVFLGSSFAFAVANSEAEARAAILARNDHVFSYGIYPKKRPNFGYIEGPPTRVIEIEPGGSYAEIIEWSE